MLKDNKKAILTDAEDVGTDGAKGQYFPRNDENSNIIFLADMSDPDTDDEILQMQLDQIPHVNNSDVFKHYFINPTD